MFEYGQLSNDNASRLIQVCQNIVPTYFANHNHCTLTEIVGINLKIRFKL